MRNEFNWVKFPDAVPDKDKLYLVQTFTDDTVETDDPDNPWITIVVHLCV